MEIKWYTVLLWVTKVERLLVMVRNPQETTKVTFERKGLTKRKMRATKTKYGHFWIFITFERKTWSSYELTAADLVYFLYFLRKFRTRKTDTTAWGLIKGFDSEWSHVFERNQRLPCRELAQKTQSSKNFSETWIKLILQIKPADQ